MTGLIILAAGSSSRLGFPKQTLLFKGKTLLELAIEAGIKSKCSPVTVILGANGNTIQEGIKHFKVDIIHNPDWAEGMASSLRTGIKNLQHNPEIDGAVVMLCDQPFVTRTVIDNLLYKQQATGKKIVASNYNGITGAPALFNRALFSELLLLQGYDGAKKILAAHPDDIALIPFEKGSVDIDTVADYEELIKNA